MILDFGFWIGRSEDEDEHEHEHERGDERGDELGWEACVAVGGVGNAS